LACPATAQPMVSFGNLPNGFEAFPSISECKGNGKRDTYASGP